MRSVRRTPAFAALAVVTMSTVVLSGCVRIWGGTSYTKRQGNEVTQKTYILDTYEFTSKPNTPPGI